MRTCDWYKGAMVHTISPGYMYLLHSIFSLMSLHLSSPSLESSNSAATWKHKYKALQAEHASTYSRKMKRWGFGSGRSQHFYLLISLHIHSIAETQMSAGQVLKWMVDMFREPREMVEENYHWNEMVDPEDADLSSAESVFTFCKFNSLTLHQQECYLEIILCSSTPCSNGQNTHGRRGYSCPWSFVYQGESIFPFW